MRKLLFISILSILLCPDPSVAQGRKAGTDRQPVWAGSFYPAGKEALQTTLKGLFENASPRNMDGRVRFLIVPHAGYSYSGAVAASGYGSIPENTGYKNIFLIASSHREYFKGSSVYAAGDYVTPLGTAKVNRELAAALIEKNRHISFIPRAHDREHSIEVQIPFIQYHFREPPTIVPIVIGTPSLATARDLATALIPYFTPDNLFVISADFSHYPEYEDAVRVDKVTGDALLVNDPEHFYKVYWKNRESGIANLDTPCCSWSSVLTLLYMSSREEQLEVTPIEYRNSGDAPFGDRERVVGYWAIAGFDRNRDQSGFRLSPGEKDILLKLARNSLNTFLETNELPEISGDSLPEILQATTGAFVSLYKHGQLRGCIGNFDPQEPLYRVVQNMSIAAATRDGRFYPVHEDEMGYIAIEISVLTPLRKIDSEREFQLGRHGIYMKKDGRSGTYLPQVAHSTGWDKESILGHCARDKAGIGWEGWKDAELFVYEAIVFGEKDGS